MTETELEQLRENSGLFLDRDGRFFHEGRPVEHPKVLQAFRRGLFRAPNGRPAVRFGATWAYLELESTLLRVTHLVGELDVEGRLSACIATLDDGTTERLVPSPGWAGLGDDEVFWLAVKGGSERARCLPPAHAALGEWLVEVGGGWALRTGAGVLPLLGAGR